MTKPRKQLLAILPSHVCPEGTVWQLRGSIQMEGEWLRQEWTPSSSSEEGESQQQLKPAKAVRQFTPLALQSKLPQPYGTLSISCLVDVIFTSYSCFFLKWILLHCKTNFVPLLNKCWLLINTLPSWTSSICKKKPKTNKLKGEWTLMKRNST